MTRFITGALRRHARPGLCAAAIAFAGGCFGGSPEPRYYALEPAAPTRRASAPYPFTLLVRRFDTALAYDRAELVYRAHARELRFDPYRLWVARPGQMLSEVIASHLEALGLFEAVTLRATERPASYELRGDVVAIDEIDPAEGAGPTWKARLALRLALSSADSGAIVWQRSFETVRDVARHDPRAVVDTLAAILDDELAHIAGGLDETFARITSTAPRLGPRTSTTP